jgi:hypothetical protein
LVSAAHQSPQQRFRRVLRITTRHAIAAQQKAISCAGGDQAVQDEAVCTQRQHDLTAPDVFGRAAFDLDHIARPKGRQHAFAVNFPVNPQRHALMWLTTSAQNVRH